MTDTTQENPARIFAAKISRNYQIFAAATIALVAGVWLSQHAIIVRKSLLQDIGTAAAREADFVGEAALLVAEHQETQDGRLLAKLKQAADKARTDYEALAPKVFPKLERASADADRQRAFDIEGQMHGFIDMTGSYAAQTVNPHAQAAAPGASPASANCPKQGACKEDSSAAKGSSSGSRPPAPHADEAAMIGKLATHIPDDWNAAIGEFTAAVEKEVDVLNGVSFVLYAALLALLSYVSERIVRPSGAEVLRLQGHLDEMGSTDMLTGLYNRAMFYRVSSMLISGAYRNKLKLGVLAADIDGLRKINDTYGRATGDAAIKAVARTLHDTLRGSDVMGRVEGGEFGLFLPSTDEHGASLVAEKLRVAVEKMQFTGRGGTIIPLRVSIGAGEMQEKHRSPDDMLRYAEIGMRAAKSSGRNRVAPCSASSPQPVKV